MIQDLTSLGLTYSFIGAILRVYSWTVFSVIAFFMFKIFKYKTDLKIHYLFLASIPFFLSNAVIYSLKIDLTSPIFLVEILTFIGGLLFLIPTISMYFYFKERGRL
ncbi:MAG: hypothetical protein AABX61_01730 [Nanoarchaeota archaeon]